MTSKLAEHFLKLRCRRLKQLAARREVAKAVKEGLLQKLDGTVFCVDCNKPAKVYDHRNYNKPLEVSPVCYGCNVRRGPDCTKPKEIPSKGGDLDAVKTSKLLFWNC